MKCIKDNKTGHVQRVSDHVAADYVKRLGFSYCPKSEFKAQEAAKKEGK